MAAFGCCNANAVDPPERTHSQIRIPLVVPKTHCRRASTDVFGPHLLRIPGFAMSASHRVEVRSVEPNQYSVLAPFSATEPRVCPFDCLEACERQWRLYTRKFPARTAKSISRPCWAKSVSCRYSMKVKLDGTNGPVRIEIHVKKCGHSRMPARLWIFNWQTACNTQFCDSFWPTTNHLTHVFSTERAQESHGVA